MKVQSPDAELLYWTKQPFHMIYQLFFHAKHEKPFGKMRKATNKEFRFVFNLLCENWCGLLEMPTFVWKFVLPKSLHSQVRAHRHWSFFSQSHQLKQCWNFATKKEYFEIPTKDSEVREIEKGIMSDCQEAYEQLIREGCIQPGMARGVLPQHINLGLIASCNLRAMFQVIVLRRCNILQTQYWHPLLQKMKQELCKKVDSRFAVLFRYSPCDINKRCLSPIEQELRVQNKDPHSPCFRYMHEFRKDRVK